MTVDVLGLRACDWTIRVGHGTGGDLDRLKGDSNKSYLDGNKNGDDLPPCDRVGVVGCHMNEQNAGVTPGRGIPNHPKAKQDKDGEITDAELPGIIDEAYSNGLTEAEKECDNKDSCCDSVKITVDCKGGTARADTTEFRNSMNDLFDKGYDTEPKCSKKRTYDCKSKQWSD
jgi:hypothetical protein